MTNAEELLHHLQSLQPTDRDSLFSLLPEIERATEFGHVRGGEKLPDGTIAAPYWSTTPIVNKVFEAIMNLGICVSFDWPDWIEGREILDNKSFDYGQLDTVTLCKLLTVIIRADRFNEGYLVSCFEDGTMGRIITALRNKML